MKMLKGFILGALITAIILSLVLTATAESTYKQITVDYNSIKIYIDDARLYPKDINGNPVEPFVYNGTTFLPLRAIGQAIGYDVAYNQDNNTVTLLKPTGASPSSAPASPSPSPESLNTTLRSNLLLRINIVIQRATNKASETQATINDYTARGMARSSNAEIYRNMLNAINADISDMQSLKTLIQNATTNDQLQQYDNAIQSYEAKY